MKEILADVCRHFRIDGEVISYEEIKVGIVNGTYKVNVLLPEGREKSFMIQKINTYVFRNPVGMMENIDHVTEFIRARNSDRVTLHFHHTEDRKTYYENEHGFWRLFNYIDSDTYNVTDDMEVVRNAGAAFGEFQMQLADFEAESLVETIPDFHNTKKRFETLWADVKADPCQKAKLVQEELDWFADVEEKACRLSAMCQAGELPLRVTHNDTKISNVLFEKGSHKPLVVIDLDTVMPGLVGNDFGDAIRSAANFVEEDCPNPELAGLNMDIYAAFAEGFLKQTAGTLTREELETLPLSCFAITVEQAVRFLADYLIGDPYYHIDYPEHNLVRARCQIALAKDMMGKMGEMEQVIHRICLL